jgi:ABC-type branched-subunit amino acid transport system substrate-binding protein
MPAFPAWGPGIGDEVDGVVSALTATPVPVPIHGEVTSFIVSPGDGGRVALIGPDTAGGATMRARRAFGLVTSDLPFEVVADIGYRVEVDPDWKGVVNTALRAGAGAVRLEGSCRSALLPFLRAAADADWDPAVIAGDGAYDPGCIAEANDVSFSRVLVDVPFLPASDGAAAPATSAVAEMLAEVDVPLTGDSLRAASAFWLWATAAEACGSQLDRACVIEQASAIDEWSAGGLHAVTDPGTSAAEPCAVLLGVDDGAFVRRLPEAPGEMDCDALE